MKLIQKCRELFGFPAKRVRKKAPHRNGSPEGDARQRIESASANYTHYNGAIPQKEGQDSPVLPLYSEDPINGAVQELKAMLASDETVECKERMAGEIGQKIRSLGKLWYQRIDYPQHGLSSTSDHRLAYVDEGSFNRLGGRLTSQEACVLRPWPKWFYVKPILPSLIGKSVLELGSSHGFFSFRFAEAGAREVTGIEIMKRQCESAVWSASMLGFKNVKFLNTDFLLDLRIPQHDIIFLSEVHNHFLFPFYGLLRMVNLAREMVIWDGVVENKPAHALTLNTGWHDRGHLIYHSFHLSESLVLDFLNLIGIPPAKVTRYRAPDQPNHVLFAINTKGLAEARKQRKYPEYLRKILELDFVAAEDVKNLGP